MRYIPCTIEKYPGTWAVTVPAAAVDTAAGLISELLAGTRKRLVFLDGKTEFVLTSDTAAYNGRQVPIDRNFLECLDKLFSHNVRPGISHIDFEFSDKHGDIDITIRIGDMRYK